MNDNTDKENKGSLLDRAEKLREQAGHAQDQFKNSGRSGFAIRLDRLKLRFPFIAWLMSLVAPIVKLIVIVIALVVSWLRWAAYVKSGNVEVLEKNGTKLFSFRQFVLRSLATIFIVVLIHASLSFVYFYSTKFTETVYVTGKQEIETGERYQFGGCTSLPCSTNSDNGKFYLIETSIYFPRLYYPEENVFANIPQQNAACLVEGYGIYFRNLRWLYKSAQLYQHVHDVSCRPYTDEELSQAIGNGISSSQD